MHPASTTLPLSLLWSFPVIGVHYYIIIVVVTLSLLLIIILSPRRATCRLSYTRACDLLDTTPRGRCENPVGSPTVTGHISRTCRPLFNHRLSPLVLPSLAAFPSVSPATEAESLTSHGATATVHAPRIPFPVTIMQRPTVGPTASRMLSARRVYISARNGRRWRNTYRECDSRRNNSDDDDNVSGNQSDCRKNEVHI